ncbi:MAG: prefoldin subunit alpha [Candidatus Woesearchaeota archaeon]
MTKEPNESQLNDDSIKEAYFEMQAIQQQMKQMYQQIKIIENQVQEFEEVAEAVKNLKDKTGSEIFASLGGGVFARGELKHNNKFIVNIGANVAVEKNGDETFELLKKQIEELKSYKEQLLKGMQLLESRAKEIEKMVS